MRRIKSHLLLNGLDRSRLLHHRSELSTPICCPWCFFPGGLSLDRVALALLTAQVTDVLLAPELLLDVGPLVGDGLGLDV